MPSTAMHALRDQWYVSFLPLITADLVNTEYKGDWKLAAHQKIQRLDWVTTVEEIWSTMNSLPKIQSLGVGTTFILARNDKEPSFEAFPNGSRLVINLLKAPAIDKGQETVLAAVLGESVTEEASNGVAVCDVVRLAARPSREYADMLRVEVWLNDASFSMAVTEFFKNAFRDRGIAQNQFTINENPFESGSPSSPKQPKTPFNAGAALTTEKSSGSVESKSLS